MPSGTRRGCVLLKMNQIPPGGGDDFFAKSMVWMAVHLAVRHPPGVIHPHPDSLSTALPSTPQNIYSTKPNQREEATLDHHLLMSRHQRRACMCMCTCEMAIHQKNNTDESCPIFPPPTHAAKLSDVVASKRGLSVFLPGLHFRPLPLWPIQVALRARQLLLPHGLHRPRRRLHRRKPLGQVLCCAGDLPIMLLALHLRQGEGEHVPQLWGEKQGTKHACTHARSPSPCFLTISSKR